MENDELIKLYEEMEALTKTALKELAQVLFCTACVAVPVALWYTGVL